MEDTKMRNVNKYERVT